MTSLHCLQLCHSAVIHMSRTVQLSMADHMKKCFHSFSERTEANSKLWEEQTITSIEVNTD